MEMTAEGGGEGGGALTDSFHISIMCLQRELKLNEMRPNLTFPRLNGALTWFNF